jgi:trehalose 6-phosphate phosphatase
MTHLLSRPNEVDALARGTNNVLVALDFDGTLCPIVDDPAVAQASPQVVDVLRRLSVQPRVTLAFITGRRLSDIRELLPMDAVYAGNHGLEIQGKGVAFRHKEAEAAQELLWEICGSFRASLAPWPGAWLEQKLLTATIHYRQVAAQDHETIALALRAHMQRFDALFGVRMGRKAIEIFPRVGWDKGTALGYIRQELGLENAGCICIGDDETDETMFAAFPEEICVRVNADGPSRARFELKDPQEVLTLLERLEKSIGRQRLSADDRQQTAIAAQP